MSTELYHISYTLKYKVFTIMDTLKSLAAIFYRFLKDTIKIRTVDKDDLRDVIRTNIKRHETFCKLFKTFNAQDYKQFVIRYMDKIKLSKVPSAKVHEAYTKALTGKAVQMEQRQFLSSLYNANEEFVDILKQIDKKLDTLIEEERITISDTRITHVAVLGILRQSDILSCWSMFLWSQLIKLATNTNKDIPKYRVEYLTNNVDCVARVASHMANHTGPYSFLAEADQIKRKNADFVLGASGGSFLNMISASNYTRGFFDNIETALSMLNIFRWGGEKWDDWMHERHLRDVETLQWMEQHVALLRMDMMDTDPNDPKYQKLVKVIEAYDNKISDYDRKIKSYEEGE